MLKNILLSLLLFSIASSSGYAARTKNSAAANKTRFDRDGKSKLSIHRKARTTSQTPRKIKSGKKSVKSMRGRCDGESCADRFVRTIRKTRNSTKVLEQQIQQYQEAERKRQIAEKQQAALKRQEQIRIQRELLAAQQRQKEAKGSGTVVHFDQ